MDLFVSVLNLFLFTETLFPSAFVEGKVTTSFNFFPSSVHRETNVISHTFESGLRPDGRKYKTKKCAPDRACEKRRASGKKIAVRKPN